MSLQILSAVWGAQHVDLFERALLRSLSWNEEALKGAKWNIFTDEEHKTKIEYMVAGILPDVNLNIGDVKQLRRYIDITQSAVVWQVEECLKTGDKLLIAPPDTIFGRNSVENMLEVGKEKHSCVVVPHPRVLPEILEHITYCEKSNASLVQVAWKHLHRSWSEAKWDHPRNHSFVGGVLWRLTKDGSFIIGTHRLPTVYLADFTDEDLEYFKTTPSFGSFDHLWPGEILMKRGRQRYIASSDVAFICEITDGDKNVPPVWDGPKTEFWRQHFHNEMNKQYIFTFRGD